MQTIYQSAGAIAYTEAATISGPDGLDVSTAAVEVTLLPSYVPTPPATGVTWRSPEISTAAAPNRLVQLLIGGSFKPTPGYYRLWARVINASPTLPVFTIAGGWLRIV